MLRRPRHRPAPPPHAELHCLSHFSFLAGASSPAELVRRAIRRGYRALALTDDGSLAGVVHAHEAWSEWRQAQEQAWRQAAELLARAATAAAGLAGDAGCGDAAAGAPPGPPQPTRLPPPPTPAFHFIVGAQMRLAPAAPGAAPRAAPGGEGATLVLLAQSRRGYGNLSQWVTVARRRAPKGQYLALATDLEGAVPHAPFLAGLPGCHALLLAEPGDSFRTVHARAMWLKTWFGSGGAEPEPSLETQAPPAANIAGPAFTNVRDEAGRPVPPGLRCSLGVELHHRPCEARLLRVLRRVSRYTGLPLVACGGARMHVRSRQPLLDVLCATRAHATVATAGAALQANGERHLRSRLRLHQLYGEAWMQHAVAVAASCRFTLDELRYEYPREIVPEGHTPTSWLRTLTLQGVARRFPGGAPAAVQQAIEHELALIAQLAYEPYFLTVADIVHWARSQGILCQGRGSAANSAVCYCLGVTEVDPARTQLLFERFISAERNEPPDIDIDFEHQRREEVIQYIYRKYGRHRAALTGVMVRYRPRSALRDVGRALGFELQRVDAVAKAAHGYGSRLDAQCLVDNGFDPAAPLPRLWLALAQQLIGFPRHLSQHPGGFVIARDDLSRLVPVENAAMEGRSVIQWDKDDLDVLGLIKVDILALGMLSAIRRSLAFVAFKLGSEVFQMQQVPAEDAKVYDMLCAGDSVGTFQVESRAQMSMLPRLKPRNFYDLVIEVAIVRPGPIQGGMVHPYLRRRSGEEPVAFPSDEVRQALGRTLGVPIFQEQVMQLAILAADFTPGEADRLRRAMAAWKRKGGLGPFYERLVGRMVAKGYEREFAEGVFRQIEGFGEYGFPESHAASFALLVYVSAWLKCRQPDAFLAAMLNSQPLGFYAPAQLVRDAREYGVQVRPVCLLNSQWETVLEPLGAQENLATAAPDVQHLPLFPVRLGFGRIAGLSVEQGQRILAARAQAPFASVEDLSRRAQLDAKALGQLARAGALRALAGHRHQAAWAVAGVDTQATALLQASRTREAAPVLQAPLVAEDMLADYQSLGLSLDTHPLALLRETLQQRFRVQPAAVLRGHRNGQLARASGLVTHRQRPETAKGVVFVTLEDDTGAVNVIVWPAVAEQHRRVLMTSRLLTVFGTWQCEGPVQHLVARRLEDHTPLLQGLLTQGDPASPGTLTPPGGAGGRRPASGVYKSRDFR